jgi:hypothetical protein
LYSGIFKKEAEYTFDTVKKKKLEKEQYSEYVTATGTIEAITTIRVGRRFQALSNMYMSILMIM